LTPLPQDVGAAREASDLKTHYDTIFDRQMQTLNMVSSAIETSTTWLKIVWDQNKEAFTSYIDEEQSQDEDLLSSIFGQQPSPVQQLESLIPKLTGRVRVVKSRIGDIDEIIVPPMEMYIDRDARTWDEVQWIDHAKVRTLEYIREKFGWRGWLVKGDKDNNGSTRWESRLDGITGDPVRTHLQAELTSAILHEYWEKPTLRFPIGRLLRVAGGFLLTEPDVSDAQDVREWMLANPHETDLRNYPRKACDWPYLKNDDFPFAPLSFKPRWGTIWSSSAARPVISHQKEISNLISRFCDQINTIKPTILVPLGGLIKTDQFQSRRSWQILPYDGAPPTYIQGPPPPQEALALVALLKGLMEDSLGVHDPTNGIAPTPDASGVMVQKLKESDQSMHAPFFAAIEQFHKKRLEWEISLCGQFYNEPRLVGVSAGNDPAEAVMNARSFEHLTSGGQVRVEVVPGSAIPKSPDAMRDFWLELLKSGGFTPDMFPALIAVFDQLGLEDADALKGRFYQACTEVIALTKAMNPQPDPAAAQQAMLAPIMAKGQIDSALKDKDIQGKIAVAQIGAQSDAQQTDQKLHAEMLARNSETQSLMTEHAHATALEMLQTAHAAATPTIALKGTLTPTGEVSAEVEAGLNSSHAEAVQMAQRPISNQSASPTKNP
jgi:hypothetical protein